MKKVVINFRTTLELKQRLKTAASIIPGYTMTRLIEEGAELILSRLGKNNERG